MFECVCMCERVCVCMCVCVCVVVAWSSSLLCRYRLAGSRWDEVYSVLQCLPNLHSL